MGSSNRRSHPNEEQKRTCLLHQLDPLLRACCCYTYCCDLECAQSLGVVHMLYLICLLSTAILGCLLPARKGKSVFAEIHPPREKGWISSSDRPETSLSCLPSCKSHPAPSAWHTPLSSLPPCSMKLSVTSLSCRLHLLPPSFAFFLCLNPSPRHPSPLPNTCPYS